MALATFQLCQASDSSPGRAVLRVALWQPGGSGSAGSTHSCLFSLLCGRPDARRHFASAVARRYERIGTVVSGYSLSLCRRTGALDDAIASLPALDDAIASLLVASLPPRLGRRGLYSVRRTEGPLLAMDGAVVGLPPRCVRRCRDRTSGRVRCSSWWLGRQQHVCFGKI